MAGVREKKKQKTQREILRRAETLFSKKGFHETTMEEIAEAAFVGVGTLYNYFGGKGELLLASMTRLTEEILADTAAADSRHEDAQTAVTDLLETYLDGLLSVDTALMREVLGLAMRNPDSFGHRLFRLDERLVEQLGGLLATLRDDGLLAEDLDPEEAAFLLYGQTMTFLLLWTQSGAPAPDERRRRIESMVDLVFRSWTPETNRRRRT